MPRGLYCVLLVTGSSAVVHARPPLELGGYAGGTSSKPLTYECVQLDSGGSCSPGTSEPHYRKRGFALGAYVRLPVHPLALIEADLLYAQKGDNDGPNGTRTTNHYLELPLLVEIDPLRTSSHARVFALAGLSPAISVACTVNGPIFDNTTFMAVNYSGACSDLPPPLNNREPKVFDLGLVVGAGVGWNVHGATVEFQARYTRGLVDTRDDNGDGKTINRAVFLMVGFGVAIHHR